VRAQNLEKKILEILSTTDSKKKLEIDYKNLEISEICTDEKSRDLHFSRNVNLEKIYLYDGPSPTTSRSLSLLFKIRIWRTIRTLVSSGVLGGFVEGGGVGGERDTWYVLLYISTIL